MSEERNSNDVEDKISIKEIHETFWRCRDFELSHAGVYGLIRPFRKSQKIKEFYGKDQYFFQLS